MKKSSYKILIGWLAIIFLVPMLKAEALNIKAIYSPQIVTRTNEELEQLAEEYEEITELLTIGYSTTKNMEIKALKLGMGERSILINGAHHGREALTTVLILNQIQYLGEAYKEGKTINGQDVRTVLNTISIYFVPLVNPEGAEIALSERPQWKANGRGVDLNRNYPTSYATLVTKALPGASGYAGTSAFSEAETQAMRDLCIAQDFMAAIAYHSAGEVIYWWYHQTGQQYNQSLAIGKQLAVKTGYSLMPISQSKGGLGFTDWFIQSLNKPSYTLEIGKNANGRPLNIKEYEEIWKENKDVPFLLAVEMLKLNTYDWQSTINESIIEGKNILGRGLVSVKAICQEMGLSYRYIPEDKSVQLVDEEKILYFKQGEKTAIYQDEPLTIGIPAQIIEGQMYLPLRTILEVFK